MNYWTIVFPGEFGQHVQETWTEDQILDSYYTYWCMKMVQAGRHADLISREACIDDWVVINWACQTTEFGDKIEVQMLRDN